MKRKTSSPVAVKAQRRYPPTLGRFDLGAKIADGGMAEVFLARLVMNERSTGSLFFALKVLRPELMKDSQYINMFLDEAELHRRLLHPNTVHLFETGEDRSFYYIAMELLCGGSLLDVWEDCQRHGARMQPDILAYLGARVSEGLHHAHELADDSGRPRNLVHRDVNPSNIFLTFDGRVKVIDFGFAKAEDRITQTAHGVVKGKLAYLSPEQIDGLSPDRRADIFALGTSLWEVATDRRLFRQDNDIDTVRAIHACAIPDPREFAPYLSADFTKVILRALERDPKKRHATAADLARDLDRCVKAMGFNTGPGNIAQLLYDVCEWGRGA